MNAKLTLSIEQDVIERAKKYAQSTRRSISALVEDYLSSISAENQESPHRALNPITRDLAGIIKTKNTADYEDILTNALMEKYLIHVA
jgi:hypothetical protein